MKFKKKFNKKLIPIILCLLALVALRFVCYSRAWGVGNATLYYTKRGESRVIDLKWEDWFTISRIFNFNPLEEKWSRCPVSENLSIKWGFQTFYIAGDGCGLVYLPDRDMCFQIDERDKLWEILEKYDVHY